MNQTIKSKEFILAYFNAMSNNEVTPELLAHWISDQKLIEHILFFESVFPKYTMATDDIIAEGNQVVVRARLVGKHEGALGDIMPTHRTVNVPAVICYVIENNKIVSHWLISDQMLLMQQLGVEPVATT
jgi:predicted ester cyclase